MRRFLLRAALCLAAVGVCRGHEIPVDVSVHVLVKPAGKRLQALARIPLRAVRDVQFPQFGPGYLDVERLEPQLDGLASLWIAAVVEIYENGERLPAPRIAAAQISIQSDKSFASFERALAHVTGPLPANSARLVWDQVWFDVLLEYPIESGRSQFSMRPGFEGTASRVVTFLRFLPPGGAVREYRFVGDPGVTPLDPRWFQAARHFVELGFWHILEGVDHLLFLFCLVIPFRRMRPLIAIVTAFTVAHSLTLTAAALGLAPDALWFPPAVETLIAASIFYMALENIVGVGAARRRWLFALGFGLAHGFGFSFALGETLQFAGAHLAASLLAFNVGVELGQLLALLVLVPALHVFFRFVATQGTGAARAGVIVLSALAAHVGWHWMLERAELLSRYFTSL